MGNSAICTTARNDWNCVIRAATITPNETSVNERRRSSAISAMNITGA